MAGHPPWIDWLPMESANQMMRAHAQGKKYPRVNKQFAIENGDL